jgi:hypothetical protein
MVTKSSGASITVMMFTTPPFGFGQTAPSSDNVKGFPLCQIAIRYGIGFRFRLK